MAENNIGLSSIVKEAFVTYLMTGVGEIQPVTKQLKWFNARSRDLRVRVVPSRMIDDVMAMLDSFWRNESLDDEAIDAELPVIFIAFGKNMRPAPSGRGYSRVQGEAMTIGSDGKYFNTRLAFKEWDIQIAVFGHEQESVIAIMDYLRLYFARFQNHRWPIHWHYNGYDFQTYGMLNDTFEPEEMVVDIGERTNIVCHTFNFPIGFMMPYIAGEEALIDTVGMQIQQPAKQSLFGVVDQTTKDLPNGQWHKDIGNWNNHADSN